MKLRAKATLIHLAGSALVAALAAFLVFGLWYPAPMAALMGGGSLFLLMVAVDVVMGPALTAVVANERKPKAELLHDLIVILLLQLSALGYGVYTMAMARPVVLAYEVGIFRLISAAEIEPTSLSQAPDHLQALAWMGPRTLAATKPLDPDEQLRTIELGLSGVPLAALPAYWRDYSTEAGKAWASAQPIDEVLIANPGLKPQLEAMARSAATEVSALRTLPLLARRAEGTVLLAPPDARIVGILPVAISP